MAISSLSLPSSLLLNHMCWLCNGETDALRYHHSLNPGPVLFRTITLESQDVAGQEARAQISAVISEPRRGLFGNINEKPKPQIVIAGLIGKSDVPRCPVYDKASGSWTFRVHADCWELVSCRAPDPIACATAFCRFLISTNRCSDNLYHVSRAHVPARGSARSATGNGRNSRRASMRRLESFDGLEVELGLEHLPTVHEPVSLTQLGVYASPVTHNIAWPSKASRDPFSALPTEIVQHIIEHTQTSDLTNLRSASRAVACISGPAHIPRSFWRSRFVPPFEMGFALAERVDESLDWRTMYFLLKGALQRQCVVYPRMESPLLTRLAKRRFWWERLERVTQMGKASWDK